MSESIAVKEIAKEVRKDLKAAYPNTKFSVTSDHNTLRIKYVDGPVDDDVEAIAMKYNGRGGYDPNYCDYTTNSPVMFRGEMVHTRLLYVFVSREYSDLGLTVVHNREINRLQLVFNDKPPADVRKVLKAHGFRWSPNEGAWQRHLNSSGEFAKDLVIKSLQNGLS